MDFWYRLFWFNDKDAKNVSDSGIITAVSYTHLYNNIKSECAFKLAELINKRQIHIICSPAVQERIKQEMTVLKSKNTNSAEQKRELISKDTMKPLLGRSPDFLDMLIMRMIFEIKPKATGMKSAKIIILSLIHI